MIFDDAYTRFLQKLSAISQEFDDNFLAIAVSGGADSIFLLHHMAQIQKLIYVFHVNYQTRDASDFDSAFVSDFAKNLGMQFCEIKVSDFSLDMPNFESLARKIRYSSIEKELEKKSIPCLLTAHHQDDLLETIFIKLSRGSGHLSIAERRPMSGGKILLRPMLNLPKSLILQYLNENCIAYQEDLSNTNTKFLRNFFRNDILPLLKAKIPEFNTKIYNFSQEFSDEERFLRAHASSLTKQIFAGNFCERSIFLNEDKVMQIRILQNKSMEIFQIRMKRKQIYEILRLIAKDDVQSIVLYKHKEDAIFLERGKIFFVKDMNKNIEKKEWILHNDVSVQTFGEWRACLRSGQGFCCSGPVVLRSVRQEDQLSWGNGHKKVLSLLKDKKIPRLLYPEVLVLEKDACLLGVLSPDFVYIDKSYRCSHSSNKGLYFEYLGRRIFYEG